MKIDKTKQFDVCCSYYYFNLCQIQLNIFNCDSTKWNANIYRLTSYENVQFEKFCQNMTNENCPSPDFDYFVYLIIAAFILLLFGSIFCYFFLTKYVGSVPTKMAMLQSDSSLIKSDEIDKFNIKKAKQQYKYLPMLKPIVYEPKKIKNKKSRIIQSQSAKSIDSDESSRSLN